MFQTKAAPLTTTLALLLFCFVIPTRVIYLQEAAAKAEVECDETRHASVGRALTVAVDVEGWRELFGSDAGQATLLQGLLRNSFCCLRLPTSVAHPERAKAAERWSTSSMKQRDLSQTSPFNLSERPLLPRGYLDMAISTFFLAMSAAFSAASMARSTFSRILLALSGIKFLRFPLTNTLCLYLPSSLVPSGKVVHP